VEVEGAGVIVGLGGRGRSMQGLLFRGEGRSQ